MAFTPLFGGALSASLPPSFSDLSAVRPVPDHQEVFSEAREGGAVLVVEVVEFQASVSDDAIARYLWEDLAECSGSATAQWRDMPAPPAGGGALLASPRCRAARCGVGVHAIAQGGVESPQLTCVALCALRLPGMASEVVASAAVPAAGEGAGAAEARAEALLGALLPTLCVHDWGLFGGDV
jgi:hypothetical protein